MPYDPTTILKRPIITERTTALKGQNKYVFVVDPRATKGQIREAVEAAFKVNVLAVNTARMTGKLRRRMGPKSGYRPDWKKAVITVKPGQEIKYAEPAA
ncbi:MAG: 50S ribosomal protein L23 [Elusimicrobia bacterium]|nr:50S ribosomal protein L23 [Elusimicrobiota bacterium]